MTSSTIARHVESQAVLLGIVLVVAAAWAALLAGQSSGPMIICGAATDGLASGTTRAVNLLAMWLVMMPAMMLPAAALDIVALSSSGRIGQHSLTVALTFAAGYLAIVAATSFAAASLQWLLQSAELLSDGARLSSRTAGGTLLAIAGLYQLSGLKRVSTERCHDLQRHDAADPMVLGLRHGLACIDCCVVMICVQFVVGVMNAAWMAALVAFMIAERLLPFRWLLARLSGMALIAAGAILAFA